LFKSTVIVGTGAELVVVAEVETSEDEAETLLLACEAVAQMGKLVVVGASLANGTAVTLGNTTVNIE
jgi:hypothetical protein